MGVKNSEVAAILASLEGQGLVRHDGATITILDSIGLRRRACRCYDAMKRAYTLERLAKQPRGPAATSSARVLPMRPGVGSCTLCGSSTRLPHRNGHECILALDEEINTLMQRTHHASQVSRAAAGQSRAALPRHPHAIDRSHLTPTRARRQSTCLLNHSSCWRTSCYFILAAACAVNPTYCAPVARFRKDQTWQQKICRNCSLTN